MLNYMTIFDEYPAFGSFEAVEHNILLLVNIVIWEAIAQVVGK